MDDTAPSLAVAAIRSANLLKSEKKIPALPVHCAAKVNLLNAAASAEKLFIAATNTLSAKISFGANRPARPAKHAKRSWSSDQKIQSDAQTRNVHHFKKRSRSRKNKKPRHIVRILHVARRYTPMPMVMVRPSYPLQR